MPKNTLLYIQKERGDERKRCQLHTIHLSVTLANPPAIFCLQDNRTSTTAGASITQLKQHAAAAYTVLFCSWHHGKALAHAQAAARWMSLITCVCMQLCVVCDWISCTHLSQQRHAQRVLALLSRHQHSSTNGVNASAGCFVQRWAQRCSTTGADSLQDKHLNDVITHRENTMHAQCH
jgi:hypothetical protein